MQRSAQERFATFHKLNPQVYDQLRVIALTLRHKGQPRCGIRLIWERLRWDHLMSTDDPDSSFKLNDHYKEFYARLLMKNEPELAGFFFTRTSRADEQAA